MSSPESALSDRLDILPTDQNNPTHSELQIVDTLFKQKHKTIRKMLEGTQDILIAGILFFILSLPQIDQLIKNLIPTTANSDIILLGAKSLVFMILFFILRNLYLVRK